VSNAFASDASVSHLCDALARHRRRRTAVKVDSPSLQRSWNALDARAKRGFPTRACKPFELLCHVRRRWRGPSSSWPSHDLNGFRSFLRAPRITRRAFQRSDGSFRPLATRTSFGMAMASALPSKVPSVKPTQYVPQFLPCNPNCFSNHISKRRKPTC